MRAILSKAVALSLIAGAGMFVSACGGSTTTVNNTVTTEVISTENGAEDTMVTGIDGATGNGVVVETNTTEATGNTN
jgi:hypothetical protein